MIAYLKGIIILINDSSLVIDVNGVGYLVYSTIKDLSNISLDQEISIHIETSVKEDSITLYGFINSQDKDFFNLITKVNGVGAKVALAILGVISTSRIIEALINQDVAVFQSVPGIGKKLALRIVTELKDKFSSSDLSNINITKQEIQNNSILNDAIMALTGLGYSNDVANKVVNKIYQEDNNLSVQEIIKLSLKELNI